MGQLESGLAASNMRRTQDCIISLTETEEVPCMWSEPCTEEDILKDLNECLGPATSPNWQNNLLDSSEFLWPGLSESEASQDLYTALEYSTELKEGNPGQSQLVLA